ncbi:MAG: response regulator transcription factor [Thermoleophilia bacterium]|nr:response regulator transcription factor [Thermoleophilia bacterium]
MRVLLVDDNDVYRSTLVLLLHGRDGIEVVGEVADGSEVAAAVAEFAPDVVVMDYRLPGLQGDEAAAAVHAIAPGVAVICLTAEATPEERTRVLAAGVSALLEKGCSTAEIVDAIRSAGTP